MSTLSPSVAERLRNIIATEGAVSIATFMSLANAHYYATRDPLGVKGDFTTAPEISQMFGELIGLWLADIWYRMGQPTIALVELGPGRGTLMADIRRAMSSIAGLANAETHLVETSPVLRAAQEKNIPDAIWHDDVSSLPEDKPLLIVANEFFDALPVRQLIRTADGWRERMVTFTDNRFSPTIGHIPMNSAIPPALRTADVGTIIEASPASVAIMSDLANRISQQGGAVLAIDYGYEGTATGDTLQAVKAHRYADVFDEPGNADLTAHVDFGALANIARNYGARAYGPVTQGQLLKALGIELRAKRLSETNPAKASAIADDVRRLTHDDEMGQLFKAIAIMPAGWPAPAGFPVE